MLGRWQAFTPKASEPKQNEKTTLTLKCTQQQDASRFFLDNKIQFEYNRKVHIASFCLSTSENTTNV